MSIIIYNLLQEINNVNFNDSTYIDSLGNFLPSLNDFTVFTINIRSFLANIDELLILLNTINHKFDIVVLTETWFNMDINFTINGYTLVNSLCTINKTDGLSVLVMYDCIINKFSKNVIQVATLSIWQYLRVIFLII